MLGNLSVSAIPFDQPIVMTVLLFMLLAGFAVVGLITYHKKWTYLWKEWITSLDHKKIGVMYIALALVMLLRGFADAIMMRMQQAVAVGPFHGFLPPDHFNQIFSAHGTIMIIFMAMPFLVGLMNIAVPQQIGARDVAFPFMNSVSLWLTAAGAGLVMISLALGEFSKAGWTGYAPLTEKLYSPGTGVDYWIWSFQIAGIGSLLTGINFLVTILKMRAPGMTLMRMPIFVWTTLFTNVLMVLAFPVLTVALALITFDRYLDMHFFTNTLGGNMMMYINLFWVWGHPEVYIVILPAFGVFSEVVATFSGKRLFGYKSLVYATAAIAVLSFAVWVHHFFTMGAGGNVNAVFGIATMLIAVPTGVKVFNWVATMWRGSLSFETPMLWAVAFVALFTIGGFSGLMLAIVPADFQYQDTYFVVAHFHYVLVTGAVFAIMGAVYFWLPKWTGHHYNERLGKLHFWLSLVFVNVLFFPQHFLGLAGMPRRIPDYALQFADWNMVSSLGGFAFGLTQLLFLYIVVSTIRGGAKASARVWDGADGLEWTLSSPPPFHQFNELPHIK